MNKIYNLGRIRSRPPLISGGFAHIDENARESLYKSYIYFSPKMLYKIFITFRRACFEFNIQSVEGVFLTGLIELQTK